MEKGNKMEKKTLLQGNVQVLVQAKEENKQYCKAKNYIKASTCQGKMSTSKRLDYLDEDGTELEIIEPTRETPKETNQRRVIIMTNG